MVYPYKWSPIRSSAGQGKFAGQRRTFVPRDQQGRIKGFMPTILPKFDLTTDAEYVANLVNVNIWLQTCNSTVYHIDIFYT